MATVPATDNMEQMPGLAPGICIGRQPQHDASRLLTGWQNGCGKTVIQINGP